MRETRNFRAARHGFQSSIIALTVVGDASRGRSGALDNSDRADQLRSVNQEGNRRRSLNLDRGRLFNR